MKTLAQIPETDYAQVRPADLPGAVVWVQNAFDPARGRVVEDVPQAMTVRAWLDARGITQFDKPTLCMFNGAPLLRKDWATTAIDRGDVCAFVTLPAGGGGGGGGKNPLRTVLMVAVIVAAAYVGGTYAAAFGESMFAAHAGAGLTSSQLAISKGILSAAVTVGGGAIVNTLVPAGQPAAPAASWGGSASTPAPSPTYSLSAQGNTARLGQPIPSIYGRHIVYPDFGAARYQEFVDNEQFVHQLHVIGQGEYDIEAIRIEDTPIESFEEVQTEIIPPGGTATLIHTNVVTAPEVAGQELKGIITPTDISVNAGDNSFNSSSTSFADLGVYVGDTLVTAGFANGANNGTFTVATVTENKVTVEESGLVTEAAGAHVSLHPESRVIGPFVISAPGQTASKIGIDIVFLRGLYYANTSGGLDAKTANWTIEARTIDDQGVATGAWFTLGTEAETAATNTAIRKTFNYDVPSARYEVQARRTDEKDLDARAGHEVRWQQVRAFLDETTTFDGVTTVASVMRATDNLSQRTSRLVNMIVTRKLPIYDPIGKTWSAPTATRSICWAMADVCRAKYGGELPDSRLPLDDLAAQDVILEARGNHFDGVFDTPMTVMQALNRICRCGRAVPIIQGGVVRGIRDEPQTVPAAMYNGRNIVKGSFRVNYVMPGDDTADAVEVEFFDSSTWTPNSVKGRVRDDKYTAWLTAAGKVDDATSQQEWADLTEDDPTWGATYGAKRSAKVQIFGVTSLTHAREEAEYIAGDNRWRRRIVTFATELDGMVPTYGDLIAVNHDMPQWGQGGELETWTADNIGLGAPYANAVLTLSEPVTFEASGTHYIALRRRDGSTAGPFACVAGVSDDQVQLSEPLTITPDVSDEMERTYFFFGQGDNWAQLCRVMKIRPRRGGDQVEITAVVEDSRVHVN